MTRPLNIADRLRDSARVRPEAVAVVAPNGRNRDGSARYRTLTFAELDARADRIAAGLVGMGVTPGTRLVLMVRPGLEFITLVFALFRAGAVVVLVDPGMGRRNVFDCLERVDPEGFVAIPIVHVVRLLKKRRFPNARFNVTVGRRWFWGGESFESLVEGQWSRVKGEDVVPSTLDPRSLTNSTEPAAIIFTSGSTGPPKGVLYEHGMFDAQVDLLRDRYGIEPGEVDLPGFPLFALFNAAMGVTTVVPDMDPTKPANVDPSRILEAIEDWHVTQAFGSPAMWNRIGRHLDEHGVQLPTIRRLLSAGAAVPNHVLERMTRALPDEADLFTPYGATEALPVASIGGREVLASTAEATRTGRGTCVGRTFPGVSVRIVAITEGPIPSIDEAPKLPANEIGEIVVRGPSVTRRYLDDATATEHAKVPDPDGGFWHRMGDVGYLDEAGRLWFCGRRAHIVEAAAGRMFTIPCEAILNEHPDVYRTALVGVGEKPRQRPVVVVEPEPGRFPSTAADRERFAAELREIATAHDRTAAIETFLFHRSLPVDTRHNVKINREALAEWAAGRVGN